MSWKQTPADTCATRSLLMLNMLHLTFTHAGKKAPFLASLFVASQYRLLHQANYKSSQAELGEVFTSLYLAEWANVWGPTIWGHEPASIDLRGTEWFDDTEN